MLGLCENFLRKYNASEYEDRVDDFIDSCKKMNVNLNPLLAFIL